MSLEFKTGEVTIEDLVQRYNTKRLNLSPAFQRDSVWTSRDRGRLAESILAGFPLPAIFLHQSRGVSGKPTYDVIDGKQRIESILAFMNHHDFDHWDYVKARVLDDDGQPSITTWDDMSQQERYEFRRYRIQAIEVSGDLGDVIDLFVRINSTGRRLSSAETRHARYYTSDLLKAAQSLANQWKAQLSHWRVVSASQRQRMRDVELMTELLLAAQGKKPLNKKAALDRALRSEHLDKVELNAARREVTAALTALSGILPNIAQTRFHRITDFYTLVVTLICMKDEGAVITAHGSERNRTARVLLTTFANEVDRIADLTQRLKPTSRADEFYVKYLRTVREGTDRLDQRKAREDIIRAVLGDVFDQKDGRRAFTDIQRRIVWNATESHTCSVCKKRVASFEDMHVDHIKPHAYGGPTTLSNAQLTHKKCNLRKGAKHT